MIDQFNIYNFYARNIPSFLRQSNLVFRQPVTSVNEESLIISNVSKHKELLEIDQNVNYFLTFLEQYYRFLEKSGNSHDIIKNWLGYKDLDVRFDDNGRDPLLKHFRNKYIPSFPTLINKTINIPVRLDIRYYVNEYIDHLLRLSMEKRFDRFNEYLSDDDIINWVNETKEFHHADRRMILCFLEYDTQFTNLYIMGSAYLSIHDRVAEIAISVNEHYKDEEIFVHLLNESFKIIYSEYIDQIDMILSNAFHPQFAPFLQKLNSEYKIYLVDNQQKKAVRIKPSDNELSLEITATVPVHTSYSVVYDFKESVVLHYKYTFVDEPILHSNPFAINTELANDALFTLYDPKSTVQGGSSLNAYFQNILTGGTSAPSVDEDITILPQERTENVYYGRFLSHRLDLFYYRFKIEYLTNHISTVIEIRCDRAFPNHFRSWENIYITDMQTTIGPIPLITIGVNNLSIRSEEFLQNFSDFSNLYVIPQLEYRSFKIKINLLTDTKRPMVDTRTQASYLVNKDFFHLMPQHSLVSITTEIDSTGYLIENNHYDMLPDQYELDYSFLIKNIKDFYLTKGSEASYRFLFKLLFNEDIVFNYPKNNMLVASDFSFTKQHLVFFKYLQTTDELRNQITDDSILYLLSKNYHTISYGQLLEHFIYDFQEINFHEQLTITHIVYDEDRHQIRILFKPDENLRPYIGSKMNIEVNKCIPNQFNGYYIAQILTTSSLAIHTEFHEHLAFLTYAQEGYWAFDNRAYRHQNFFAFGVNLEFLNLDAELVDTFAIVCQDKNYTMVPIKISADHITDHTLFYEQESLKTCFLLDEQEQPLVSGTIIDYCAHVDADETYHKFYYIYVKLPLIWTQFSQIRFFSIPMTDTEFMNIPVSDIEINTPAYNQYHIHRLPEKEYQYTQKQVMPIEDTRGGNQGIATISGINEVTGKLTSLVFSNTIPALHNRRYIINTQFPILGTQERISTQIGLDIDSYTIVRQYRKAIPVSINNITRLLEVWAFEVDATFSDISAGETSELFIKRGDYIVRGDGLIGSSNELFLLNFDLIRIHEESFETIMLAQYLGTESQDKIDGWSRCVLNKELYSELKEHIYDHIIEPYLLNNYQLQFPYTPEKTKLEVLDDFVFYMRNTSPNELLFILISSYEKIFELLKKWYDEYYLSIDYYIIYWVELIDDYILDNKGLDIFPFIVDNTLLKKLEIKPYQPKTNVLFFSETNQPIISVSEMLDESKIIRFGKYIYEITNRYDEQFTTNYALITLNKNKVSLLPNKYEFTRRLNISRLQDNHYYQQYAYEISTSITLERYKQILHNLVHPIGTQMFARVVLTNAATVSHITRHPKSVLSIISILGQPIISEELPNEGYTAISGTLTRYLAYSKITRVVSRSLTHE